MDPVHWMVKRRLRVYTDTDQSQDGANDLRDEQSAPTDSAGGPAAQLAVPAPSTCA